VRQLSERQQMNIQDPEVKEKLILRLRRIEGQVRGIESMLEGERDCREIMQQLSAVHAAIQGTSRIFLQEYATTCLADLTSNNTADSQENLGLKREKVIREMISLLDKTP
jgi:DNA-binding FrmR family transcriptional regulator